MPYPRSSAAIALQLLSQFRGLIDSISFKMGARYRLSYEDRQDLVNAARSRISTIKWRTVLKRGGNRPLENYVISTIQTTMSKELRRIKAAGLSGLSKGPKIAEFPQYEDSPRLTSFGSYAIPRPPASDLVDQLVAQELAERASLILSGAEWQVISMAFGFDGGLSRTPTEIAEELDFPVSKVECLLESALQTLRRSLR